MFFFNLLNKVSSTNVNWWISEQVSYRRLLCFLLIYLIHSNLFLLSGPCVLLIKHVHKRQKSAIDAAHFVRLTMINFVCLTLVKLFGIKTLTYLFFNLLSFSTITILIFIQEILILKIQIIFVEGRQRKLL